jgi:putative membrane protein
MIKILSDQERSRLDQLIANAEKRTNAQIVLAVIKRSDDYAELPWKAFALSASVAGLFVAILDFILNSWVSSTTVLIAAVVMLSTGAAFALLTIFIPGIARIFLSAHRAEVEVKQYAESLFLNRELFATSKRIGILLLVSLFERQVILLPDKGLSRRLTTNAMQDIIACMTQPLVHHELNRALESGLEELSKALELSTQGTGNIENELSDQIIEERGV